MYPTPAADSGASSFSGALGGDAASESRPGMHGVGAVRIARRVLQTVIEQATLSVAGVARLGRVPANRFGPLRLARAHEALPHHGVVLRVDGEEVSADLFVMAAPGAQLVEVGAAIQEAVGEAVEHILGLRARAVNVYIQDVA